MRIAVLKYLGKNARNATGRTWLVVALCAVLIGSAWLAEWSSLFQLVENRTYDWRSRLALRFRQNVSDRIVLIDFDHFERKSSPVEHRWLMDLLRREGAVNVSPRPFTIPLPHVFYGELVRKLHERGAAAIGLDDYFFYPGRNYPEWIEMPGSFGLMSDNYFAQVLRSAGNVVLPWSDMVRSSPPFEQFLTNAWRTGFDGFVRDSDGYIRKSIGCVSPLFSTDVLLLAKALNVALDPLARRAKSAGPAWPESLLELARRETIITWSIDWNNGRIPKVSFQDVLANKVKIDLRDKIVLVGRPYAHEQTPLSLETPWCVIHANVLNTLLTQQFIRKTSGISNFFIIYSLGMATAFLCLRFRSWAGISVTAALTAAYVAIAVWLFIQFRIWIPIAESVFVMAGVNYAMVLLPAKDRHKLVGEMFRKAGFSRVEPAGPGVWRLEKDEKFLAAACLWNGKDRDVAPALTRLFTAGSAPATISRIYVLFEAGAPPIDMLRAWKQELGCEAVPILLSLVEKASASEDCGRLLRELEEPYLVRSDPYAEFKPILDPTWFYGREELLRTLPAALAQGQHVGLFGLRKIGKTSLTNQLRQRSVAIPSAFLDCQGMNPKALSYFQEIYGQIHAELRGLQIRGIDTAREIEDGEAFSKHIHDLFKLWEESGHHEPFLVIFDEIDRFFPAPELARRDEILAQYVQVFGVLRSLSQRCSCLVALVVAYRPQANRQNLLSPQVGENPMFRSFQEVYVGNLTRRDSRKMLEEIGSWKSIVWKEGAAEAVFDYCGGHPLITRLFASDACEQGNRKSIAVEDVHATAAEIKKSFRKHDIGNYFKEGVWNLLTEEERRILVSVCRAQDQGLEEAAVEAGLDEALANLEHFGLIVQAGGRLRVAGSLLQNWLERRLAV